MLLSRRSEAPFSATVKFAFPTEMIDAADCSRPLLVTARVTTAMTAKATAIVNPMERALRDQMLRRMREKNLKVDPHRVQRCLGPVTPPVGARRRPAWPA